MKKIFDKPLFVDMDDCLLNTSEVVIDEINKKYGTSKTIMDLTDWGYKSIHPDVDVEFKKIIFSDPKFYSKTKINDLFIDFLNEYQTKVYLVTKGTEENLKNKMVFNERLSKISDCHFIGFDLDHDKECHDKSGFDMTGGIQIDDRMDALEKTNADIKILLTNGRIKDYNIPNKSTSNLYIASDWDDIVNILKKIHKTPEIFEQISKQVG